MIHNKKIAIITGGSAGIGLAIARKLSESGVTVVIASRNEVKGKLAAESVGNAIYVATDVTDEQSVKNLVETVMAKYGRIDVVVNNAGMDVTHADITMLDDALYLTMMDTNFKSVVLMTKHAIAHLITSKGTMVNIASQLGLKADAEVPLYCAAKAAAIAFTKSMALAYGAQGVRINAVCPGAINTELLQGFFENEAELKEWYADQKRVPLQRVGRPEEIASVVNFLVSDEASYVHGAVWSVDGGSSI